MPYTLYNFIHLIGIFGLLMALGGMTLHIINGGSKADNAWRKPLSILHGVSLFLILLGGFGMLARLGLSWPWPGWIIGKVTVWLLMGGIVAVIYRKRELGRVLWWVVLLLAVAAAFLALYKPF